ncbi:MAG TPA: glycoside hydrolase family 25 protein [Solirubrobacteraceae bacterium]|nr:glycoside hydrolase family 25 protein [Solirubrobacteraceae bacterium]
MDPLIVDVYAGDLNGAPDWDKLVAAGPPWHGAIIKATEGLHYAPPWFGFQWQAIEQAAGSRLGDDFFRGTYHYLHFALPGADQADYFADLVQKAGGWRLGDLPPVVDVESANNAGCSRPQVEECVGAFVARMHERGCPEVILYGGSLLYDLGITDHMGCSDLWVARYTPTLPEHVYQRIGWDAPALWQYCGDGESYLKDYPSVSPIGKVDISAVIKNGGGNYAVEWMRGVR